VKCQSGYTLYTCYLLLLCKHIYETVEPLVTFDGPSFILIKSLIERKQGCSQGSKRGAYTPYSHYLFLLCKDI